MKYNNISPQLKRNLRLLKDNNLYLFYKNIYKDIFKVALSSYSKYIISKICTNEIFITSIANISALYQIEFYDRFSKIEISFKSPKTEEEIKKFGEFADYYGILWRSNKKVSNNIIYFEHANIIYFNLYKNNISYSESIPNNKTIMELKDFMEKYDNFIKDFENKLNEKS